MDGVDALDALNHRRWVAWLWVVAGSTCNGTGSPCLYTMQCGNRQPKDFFASELLAGLLLLLHLPRLDCVIQEMLRTGPRCQVVKPLAQTLRRQGWMPLSCDLCPH
jgi:hypothetical protein